MYERFQDRAQRVIILADREARQFGHGIIGTGHLLLGLSREHDGTASKALQEQRLYYDPLRRKVRLIIGENCGGTLPSSPIPHSHEALRVQENALSEASLRGSEWVGTEHLLLSLIRLDGECGGVLSKLGIDTLALRKAVEQQARDVPQLD